MILINLLPHREVARKRRKEAFQVTMFLSALVGVLLAALVYWFMQMRIETQQERNAFLRSEIEVLNKQIKEIAGLEGEIKALRERQKRWKPCRQTETCQFICSMSWSGCFLRASIFLPSSKMACR